MQAPKLHFAGPKKRPTDHYGISLTDLYCIIVPFSCAGGVPAMIGGQTVPILAVRENASPVGISADQLEIKNLIVVNSYLEALGWVTYQNKEEDPSKADPSNLRVTGAYECLAAGVAPKALNRPLTPPTFIQL